uniref:Phosphonopyruvate decarboxylase n=1 Tax=Alexandrium monilatum TaxID=311494 RepID=A0A7S4WGN5_9DINO
MATATSHGAAALRALRRSARPVVWCVAERGAAGARRGKAAVASAGEARLGAGPDVVPMPAALARDRAYRPMDETMPTYLNPAHFVRLLRGHGTTFFTGVPDSLLQDVCAYITDHVSSEEHVIAANEGTALAMAAGHHLATGSVPCVYLQNSGLGNTVNPLLSLCSPQVYSIPALLLIGWRGEPGRKDEPQHLLQGELTPALLEHMCVPFEILPDHAEGAFRALQRAYAHLERDQSPFALLVKKGTFEKYKIQKQQEAFSSEDMLHREEILERVVDHFPSDPLVTTTGFTSREMFELRAARGESHQQDFLTVGSMGHCSSIALGIALARRRRQVLCIDGDGAALMHMGALATIGKCGLRNFKHILINNAVHDSVGGQPTGAASVDFSAIARACGYVAAECVSAEGCLGSALGRLREQPGPSFLEVRALPGARADLGRPTTSTHDNKREFMGMLGQGE